MKNTVAIHHRQGSFSERWLEYCREHGVNYRTVNCLSSDIIAQLSSANALLWHWHHELASEHSVSRQLIHAVEMMGLVVFPNLETCWHFDDKIAQKYLLEAIGAPLVPTHIFLNWEAL